MSEKRRDNRNRILRSGESQRKDGRYAYKYTDTFGKVQFVYAWKLVPTDKTPAGKRDDISSSTSLMISPEKIVFSTVETVLIYASKCWRIISRAASSPQTALLIRA